MGTLGPNLLPIFIFSYIAIIYYIHAKQIYPSESLELAVSRIIMIVFFNLLVYSLIFFIDIVYYRRIFLIILKKLELTLQILEIFIMKFSM